MLDLRVSCRCGAVPDTTFGLPTPYRYGDEEAVEDFLAIGKDPNEGDAQGRTALHYATAYDQAIIARMLLGAWVWVFVVGCVGVVNVCCWVSDWMEASCLASWHVSACCWVHIRCCRLVGVGGSRSWCARGWACRFQVQPGNSLVHLNLSRLQHRRRTE